MDSTGETTGKPVTDDRKARQVAMLLHFSVFAGFVVPLFGLIAPILVWQLKKEEYPALTAHAYVVFNWILSAVIYALIGAILSFVLIGIPMLMALGVAGIVFPIVGGIKAGDGEVWRYPLSIGFLKA